MLFPRAEIHHELLDFGNYRKLERFGNIILDRPEIEADNSCSQPKSEWKKAHWYFSEEKGKTGKWLKMQANAPTSWEIKYQYQNTSLRFLLKLTNFKHLGIFPEQAENWKFITRQLQSIKEEKKVLNLFAYTGIASIVSAANGAKVTNVDSVKQVLNWGRENASLNQEDRIRWILEDAMKFVEKSIRREDQYHGIIMDPPAFGLGTKNEKWKLEKNLQELVENCLKLLHPKRSFFILNTYSNKFPLSKLEQIIRQINSFPKNYKANTLGLTTKNGNELPLGNLIRFSH